MTDDDGGAGTDTAVITVKNAAPALTATPDRQTVQYSDHITDLTITATDVGADVLNASLSWSTDGVTFTPGLPDAATIGGGLSLNGAADQTGTGAWTIAGLADLDPAGAYTIRLTVTDEDGGSSEIDTVLNVEREDARVTYTGVLFASTPSINDSTTTIRLRATVQDLTAVEGGSDPDSGDITQATVTFIDRDTSTILASGPVQLIDPADPLTGTAAFDWIVDIGNQDAASFTIGILVEGFYTRDQSADNAVVTVSLPRNGKVTGGGHLINEHTAGTYAGDAGEKTNFGINVKFNQALTNVKGKGNVIVRQNDRVYQFTTYATDSLVVETVDPTTSTATFTAKASLEDITDPCDPVPLGGGLDLVAILTDAGEPGRNDSLGLTVWDGRELLFSSRWDGVDTVEQLLRGGNLQVHADPQALEALPPGVRRTVGEDGGTNGDEHTLFKKITDARDPAALRSSSSGRPPLRVIWDLPYVPLSGGNLTTEGSLGGHLTGACGRDGATASWPYRRLGDLLAPHVKPALASTPWLRHFVLDLGERERDKSPVTDLIVTLDT